MSCSFQKESIIGDYFFLPSLATAVADVGALAVAFSLAFFLRSLFPGYMPWDLYWSFFPVILAFPLLFALLRLYPGTFWHPAEELRALACGISLGFLLMAGSFFLLKNTELFSRMFFISAWLLGLLGVPLARHGVRRLCYQYSWWKIPVIFVATPQVAAALYSQMLSSPELGLYPVAGIHATEAKRHGDVLLADPQFSPGPEYASGHEGLGHVEWYSLDLGNLAQPDERLESLARKYKKALIAISFAELSPKGQEALLEIVGRYFHRLLIIPGFSWVYCIPKQVAYLGGAFALTVRRNLCDPTRLRIKRFFDLFVSLVTGIIIAPLLILLSILIYLDSPGPVFFRQSRIGQGGKTFDVLKFRSMQVDAEAVLDKYLSLHPEEAKEWQADRKLKHDPRITRIGRFLRRTSLDELPQLWNVLCGEMSLVGPRPIVNDEIAKYGDVFFLYTQVPPGITGLWQVSGRNDVSYEQRVAFDRYYIANWSVWLDLYILARTVPEVCGMRGAY